MARTLEIIELAAAYGPPQQPEHTADQQNAERDEDVETLDVTLRTMLQRTTSATQSQSIAYHQQRAARHPEAGKPRAD